MWKEEGGAGYVPGRVVDVILLYLEKLLSDTIVPGKAY